MMLLKIALGVSLLIIVVLVAVIYSAASFGSKLFNAGLKGYTGDRR